MRSGVLVGTYPIKIVLAGGIFGFILITYVFKTIKGKIDKNSMYCNVKISINGQSIYTKTIIDTGNFLKEPITKLPVIVIEKDIFKGIIPEHILNNLDNIIIGKEINLEEYASKIRIIPFTSLGKQNGILLGLKVEDTLIEMEENAIKIKECVVGIYNGVLNKNEKYHGLIGLDILENKDNNLAYEEW